MERRGFEPLTPTLPVSCATNCANAPKNGGRYKARTCDPLNVVQVRYQLRQSPKIFNCKR